MMAIHSIAVFDLGGVLIDWNPRYMYCKLFDGDDSAMEHFLATVCTPSWNEQQDAGRLGQHGERVVELGRGWPSGGHPGEGEGDGAAAVQVEDAVTVTAHCSSQSHGVLNNVGSPRSVDTSP
jgi:hypothetical protein